MCPCWGTGVIIASRCDGVLVGTRVHGYFPFSPTVCITPGKLKATSFVDMVEHRQHLIEAYRTYYTHDDPQFMGMSYDEEDYQMATGCCVVSCRVVLCWAVLPCVVSCLVL
jgi:hypothetical protein